MDVRPFCSCEAIGLKSRRPLLRVFGSPGFEGERVHRIVQRGRVGPHYAEVVPHFYALVRTHVHIEFHTRAEHAVEIFAEHDPSAQLSIRRSEAVEMAGHMERNRRFFHERHGDITGVDGITTEFHLGDGAVTARIDYPHPPNFSVRASCGSQHFSLTWLDRSEER